MITKNGKRILMVGDTIHVPDRELKRFINAKIAEITYQDDFGDDGLECEFRDTDGIYRNWKQRFDGGFVLNNINPRHHSTPFKWCGWSAHQQDRLRYPYFAQAHRHCGWLPDRALAAAK